MRRKRPTTKPNEVDHASVEKALIRKLKILSIAVPIFTAIISFFSTSLFNFWNLDATAKEHSRKIVSLENTTAEFKSTLDRILKVTCVGKIRELANSKDRSDYKDVVEACTQTTNR